MAPVSQRLGNEEPLTQFSARGAAGPWRKTLLGAALRSRSFGQTRRFSLDIIFPLCQDSAWSGFATSSPAKDNPRMTKKAAIVPVKHIENRILLLRGQRVMLDSDLAELYGVPTFRLNEQVKRNRERFPADFMFQLTFKEFRALISQFAISKGRGGRRKSPYAFTEHGAIMAANVLNSPRAVEMSVLVVRAFVRLREMLASNRELARKLEELEQRIAGHDEDIKALVIAIRNLMSPQAKTPKQIGFKTDREA